MGWSVGWCALGEGDATGDALIEALGDAFDFHRLSDQQVKHDRQACDLLVVAAFDGGWARACRLIDEVGREGSCPILLAGEIEPSDASVRILEGLESGAVDFVDVRASAAEVKARIDRILRPPPTDDTDWVLVQRLKQKLGISQFVGHSPVFMDAVKKIPRFARADCTVLLRGETGTGKDLFARAIHYVGRRSGGPYVPFNCGAVPIDLIENELFGHERSAYTGADKAHDGLIQAAEGGTLFLDEVDALPPSAQVKLLRFLQQKEYRRLGSAETRTADVRVIAATNGDPDAAIRAGRLRQDFFYRLNVLPLGLPALRDRTGDVVVLAEHFVRQASRRHGHAESRLTPAARMALETYDWPGNVRELEYVVERAVVLSGGGGVLGAEAFFDHDAAQADAGEVVPSFRVAKSRAVDQFEKRYIEQQLAVHGGNISQAARASAKNRRAFWELIRKHGIDADRFRVSV